MQDLARTGIGGNGGYWNPYTGYGAVDPYVLLTTNPTQFPDENPFLNKGLRVHSDPPGHRGLRGRLVDPRRINADDSYQYRGFDERLTLSREHRLPDAPGHQPAIPTRVMRATRRRSNARGAPLSSTRSSRWVTGRFAVSGFRGYFRW